MPAISMVEWDRVSPAENSELAGLSFGADQVARTLAEKLTRSETVEILELRSGLSLRSTSFVGRIQLGELHITIRPKVRHNILVTLLRYAYGLRDLLLTSDTDANTEPEAFQDILIECLIAETAELVSRGLYRQYRRMEEYLSLPRGRIDLQRLATRNSAAQADIPVIHHLRLEDTLINQVLLEGLYFATGLTHDLMLRSRLRRLASQMELGVTRLRRLDSGIVHRAYRGMSRQTVQYEPSLTLIDLLVRSTGVTLDQSAEQVQLPGFLFDMNRFFERLLTRLLTEHLQGHAVHPQYQLRDLMFYDPNHNPKRRRAPTPRPDFVVTRGNQPLQVLDAKYRDLWERPLPREMLYQLAIYALSQGCNGQATILYPSINDTPRPQVINIQQPLGGFANARITLRPVNLARLSDYLQDQTVKGIERLGQYARALALGDQAQT